MKAHDIVDPTMTVPRHVYFLILGVLFLAAGIAYTYFTLRTDLALESSGLVVDGTVLQKRERLSNPSKALSRREYLVEFEFQPPTGYVMDEALIDQVTWEQLEPQGVVRVTYLPGQPGTHRVDGEAAAFQLWKLFICIGGALLNWILYLRVR